jgi:hypothetical protein
MKRSISYYLSQGISDTKWGFQYIPLSQRLLLLVYGFVGFFGKLFFFSRPFFTLAESHLVTLMNQRKPFNVWQMFDQVVSREQYNRLMVSYFVMDLLTLFVGTILASVPLLIWIYLAPLMSSYEESVGLYNVLLIYFIALGIVALLFASSFYRPFAFVLIHHPELRSGSILTTTHKLLKKQNKISVFILSFAYFLFIYFLGFIITIQGSTVLFGTLIVSFGYQGFLSSLIFAIVFLVALSLLLLWILPLSYVLLMSIQHQVLMDSLPSSEALNPEQVAPSTHANDQAATSQVETQGNEQVNEKQNPSDKKITGKTKRKSI